MTQWSGQGRAVGYCRGLWENPTVELRRARKTRRSLWLEDLRNPEVILGRARKNPTVLNSLQLKGTRRLSSGELGKPDGGVHIREHGE
jgi:hypothetical protein